MNILSFHEIDKSKFMAVGGKGANLGELANITGINVPDGFCISTEVYKGVIESDHEIERLVDQLNNIKEDHRKNIGQISAEIREAIEKAPIPNDLGSEIGEYLKNFDQNQAFAVRSSATAEDLPTASFAGQQDTYLNISGKDAIIEHTRKCWASLFTDRAVIYRIQNGFDHRRVQLAVVVQKMIFPQSSGVMFTADPVTSNRKVISIDAGFGLGEALVSGLVNPDIYKLRTGEIIDKKISAKKIAIFADRDGGTTKRDIDPEKQNRPALADEQIVELEQIGRKIEEHFGNPQDIEWCLADDTFYIVQSRPITTLFPIPAANDQENHVYISVGHQQMMTDPIKPLGLSFWQLMSPATMFTGGGRLFVDVTSYLRTPAGSENLVNIMGKHDPLIKDAIETIIERGGFVKPLAEGEQHALGRTIPPPGSKPATDIDTKVVTDLIATSRTSLEALKQNIETKSGIDLFDFIREDLKKLTTSMFNPNSMRVIMAAMEASWWINEKMDEWLGEKNAADTLSQSVPNNITSEMGLDLLNVADVIRPYPEVIDYLQRAERDDFLDDLVNFHGGEETRDAILAYLDKYGMRCTGEIDITRTRWSEKPATLVPMILSNIKNSEPGDGKRKFEQGRQEALRKEQELLARLRQFPDGQQKAGETKQIIDIIRNLSGYREFPKYDKISCYLVYKKALLKEAEALVRADIIREKEDVFYLTFDEFREAVRTHQLNYQIIDKRKDEYKLFEKLTPPRVITSDGEIVTGRYKHENLPAGAIVGLAVSSGVIEGRARVILDMDDADLEPGDILVTTFTDPSWTPLFVSIKGLVTEVGGLMTHGAVIAREYGLPAIVGVENATKIIKDGQKIRVNGTVGYIEIL